MSFDTSFEIKMKKRLHPHNRADVANLNPKSSNFKMSFYHTSVLPPFISKPDSTLGERFEDYLSLHGQPSEYGY